MTNAERIQKETSSNGWEVASESPASGDVPSFSAFLREQRNRQLQWAFWLSIPPPLLGYFLLFIVAPWVHRGFKPS